MSMLVRFHAVTMLDLRVCSVLALGLLVLPVPAALGVSSRDCVERFKKIREQFSTKYCGDPLCGELTSAPDMPSYDRLSSACMATLSSYSPSQPISTQLDPLTALVYDPDISDPPHCVSLYDTPSHVRIQGSSTPDFTFCSPPKGGVTQFRTLLMLLAHIDSVQPLDAIPALGQRSNPTGIHDEIFPSVKLYAPRAASAPPPLAIAVGRNPYARLLSGFLDKMAWHDDYMEYRTFKEVNAQIGAPVGKLWEPTAAAFAAFVRLLTATLNIGRPVNEHFAPITQYCDVANTPFTYYLRLEDMHEWYPCVSALLGLEECTDRGWPTPEDGLDGWYNPASDRCWWAPRGMSCAEYAAARTDDEGRAVPIPAAGGGASSLEGHNLNAAGRLREFYMPETAALVYQAFRPDFEVFGYSREL